jgi:hypothetical protein
MKTRLLPALAALCCLLTLSGCDQGLAPPLETKISGVVVFRGGQSAWPAQDSLVDLRVVFFQDYPPSNLIGDVLGGKAIFTSSLLNTSAPGGYDSARFEIIVPDPVPAQFRYVAVAQQFGSNIFSDWRAVGVFAPFDRRDTPTAIPLSTGSQIENIRIVVDFNDLPPQPF